MALPEDLRQLSIKVPVDLHAFITWYSTKTNRPIQNVMADLIKGLYQNVIAEFPNAPRVPELERDAPPAAAAPGARRPIGKAKARIVP